MSNAGYSGTPLIKKLGIKDEFRVAFVNPPDDYLVDTLPASVEISTLDANDLDFVQAFYKKRDQLQTDFPALKAAIHKNGMVWISWPKKASKVATDLTEDVIREIGLEAGLVDVKVAAIDAIWSGLKFVFRKADR